MNDQQAAAGALWEAGVTVEDIMHVLGVDRMTLARLIRDSGASREEPNQPESEWTRVGRLLVTRENDNLKLSDRVRRLTTTPD